MKLTDAIEKRSSVRKFKSKHIKFGDIIECIDAALKIPLAGNIYTLKFIILTDTDKKAEIAKQADQLWMTESDYLIVVCSDSAQMERMYDAHGVKYSQQQLGAALQNFLLRVTDLGLASCWVGAFYEPPIKKALDIPEHVTVEALIPVGYADEKPKAKKKEALENVMFWDAWGIKKRPAATKEPKTW